jgi:hypothetical protein
MKHMALEDIYIFNCANWIHMAQNKVQWRALVNTVMKVWAP